jgi:DNA-binding response OmpR family regulator
MASIVIVDDNQDSARFLSRLLEFSGHVATWMPSSEATIAALKRIQPDLLVLDVMMPHLSGIDLLKLMRQEPPLDQQAVVMLSGIMDMDVQSQAFELGALDYIVKDMDWERSLARIEQHLRKN